MNSFKNIKGGKELDAFLKALPVKVERNIMRSALRQGANVIRAEAKAQVPVDSGELRNSIKVSTRSRRGVVTASVSTKLRYARLVEYGTGAHRIVAKNGGSLFFAGHPVRSVNHPGAKPKPFMRPALDGKAGEAIVATGEQIRRRLTAHGINAAPLEVEE